MAVGTKTDNRIFLTILYIAVVHVLDQDGFNSFKVKLDAELMNRYQVNVGEMAEILDIKFLKSTLIFIS